MMPTTTHSEPLPPRVARMAAELEAWPRTTVTLAEIWTLYAAADPASATRASRRTDLAETLTALAATGAISVSRTADRTATPPLPTRITLPAPQPTATARALARAVPWRPELAWAASAALTVGQVATLQTVNTWLRDRGRNDDIAPLRERSLEILGHEKRLDALLGTSLFAPGRLSLELLRTFRAHPPLPVRTLGSGPVLLVVENADTFDTLTRTLEAVPTGVGAVAWGAGAGFEASVLSVAELLPQVRDVAYFGDVDGDGLRIPASAASLAAAAGLPAVRPAIGLYQLLLEVGVRSSGQPAVDAARAATLTSWLGDQAVASAAAQVLTSGHRLAQEAVTRRQLSRIDAWARDLQ